MLSLAFIAGLVWFLFGLRCPMAPQHSFVPLLGEPVSMLSAHIDGIRLVQGRVLVAALMLVVFLLAPVGSAITPIGPPVTPIGPPVTPIRPPVTPVRLKVPFSPSVLLVGGVVALTSRLITRLTGMLSLHRDLVVQVRSQIAALRRFLTLLRRLRTLDPTLCGQDGEGSPRLFGPLRRDPVPLLGDFVALISHPVTLVGDMAALPSHAVTLVGAAPALLRLGSHRASLRRGAAKQAVRLANRESVSDTPVSGRAGRCPTPCPPHLPQG